MTEFTIAEVFPKSQIEFDARFDSEQGCQECYFANEMARGFYLLRMQTKGLRISARQLYVCTRCETSHSLTVGTVML